VSAATSEACTGESAARTADTSSAANKKSEQMRRGNMACNIRVIYERRNAPDAFRIK
jgi:hypothetical protein